MTTVSGVSNNTSQPNTSAASASSVDYNAFLKLLMAQLRTQDPTKPMESTEFMAQLASFSQVEQSMHMNTKLDALLGANALSQAETFIGRTVAAADGSVSGTVVSVKVTDEGPLATLSGGAKLLLGSGVTVS